ncbi:gliding motility lipoprotein GldB [Fulvivirgaceae bacterium PWU4]|uniref:Gliding motility lipoprotein GldB n=1 Tax=Chryseosolibacter histidini TaxID=2782349 RepID=A0AAP2GTC2_9BACT|nr:gliding motility lipoprotein GldB [Chryseosolibacter histidini]MBT1701482.1 gliding motility lipoprotein GldB [Chryseosolibacter histidini]
MKKYFGFAILIATLWSCGKEEEEKCVFTPDVSQVTVDLTFERFEDSLAGISSKQGLVELFTREPLIRDYVFRRTTYPNDSVFINTIYKKLTNPHIDTLLMETHRVFGDGSDLKAQFTQAFANIKYYYPDFVPPKVQTVISGLDSDMFFSDSLIIVSLDYYLGEGARFRPQVYDYQLRQYVKENIVPSCMLLYGISDRFNKTRVQDKTVLADMIAYGKAFYFAKHMLPCVPDSILIWYSSEEVRGSRKNQDLIWKRFIDDKVLYSTSHMVKQKYLGERPKTLDVGPECPGRIAQWIGWQIVNAYMESHPEIKLQQLMAQPEAERIFKESKYKPRGR